MGRMLFYSLLSVISLTFLVPSGFAEWKMEKTKIDFLLHSIAEIDGVFIRNDSEHTAKEAVSHLRMKLERGMNSWFAPDKEEWTAEMFIDKLASKSSLSGKPYKIKFSDGRMVLSKEWLYEKLKSFESKSPDE